MNIIKEEVKYAFIYDLASKSNIKEIYKYHFTQTENNIFPHDVNFNEVLDYQPNINYPNEIGIYIYQIYKPLDKIFYQKESIISFFINDGKFITDNKISGNYLDRVYLSSINKKRYNWLLASIKIYSDSKRNKSIADYKKGIYIHYIQPNGKEIRINIQEKYKIYHIRNKIIDMSYLEPIINIALKLLDKLSEYNNYEDFLNQKNYQDDISSIVIQQ